ncbi:hypothetical protein F0231_01335 [Vibrio sp. RE86]|uniref:hypothetical protein n=1 Tax=Vibrio sp. RE86 TaxID=2607605 RepID=UPI0014937CDC|nr:hypothetical protein [Vibrio sp. RE86]NOH78378.1 hypothetical protein [Vibrio sp. RE86]
MKLMADRTGEQFLEIKSEHGDVLEVQFISNQGEPKGKVFKDSLSGLLLAGWTHRTTSTAIGLHRFKQGYMNDAHVSFALHQLYPLGRKVRLPNGDKVRIASYANTHADGYYMFVCGNDEKITRMKMSPEWELLPSEKLLALPYYPAPRTQAELDNIDEFDQWAGGF